MEDRNSYNLTQNVSNWKQQLIKSGLFTHDNIIELESHLLEEVDNLKTKDLSEQEAFIIAKKRIGKTDSLQKEFSKVNTTRSTLNFLSPYVKGILFYLSFAAFSRVLLSTIYTITRSNNLSITSGTISFGIICFSVILVALLIKTSLGNKILNALNKIYILLIITIACNVFEIGIQTLMNPFHTIEAGSFIGNLAMMSGVPFLIVLLSSILLILKNIKSKNLAIQN